MGKYKIDLAWGSGFNVLNEWGDVVAKARDDVTAKQIRDDLNSGKLTEVQINEGSNCR